jgi:eukaryotic-like serine/threonine-protein kinase
MNRFTDEAGILKELREPTPKGRRRSALYGKLDRMVPGWRNLVHKPEFAHWATLVDSENGTRMLDRLALLLNDPAFAADDLAIILRMYSRWNAAQSRATGFRRLFQRKPQSHTPSILPVLSGKYELIKSLGRGGNGEVYLVWSTETEKFYALKTIRSDFLRNSEARQSFRDEAGAWIGMGEHPNVAKAYFFEEIEPRLYITMAYIEEEDGGVGPSLADKLSSGGVSTEKLCVWFCQVADGLTHAYRSGIKAHRDIKPGNVLISREGVAQISDFGIAATLDTLITGRPNQENAVGTPLFMPPEQFVGASECDQRSDIYSLGVTLYQAASGGNLPFMPNHSPRTPAEFVRFYTEVRNLHENATPKPISSLLWPLIDRCLRKRRSDRFPDMSAFRADLARLARQHQISVPEPAKETADFWVLRDQGNTFMRLGRYEDAIKALDAFLAVMPDDSATFDRAVCLEHLGRYEEALRTYESFAKRDDIKGIVNIGNCLRALGRKQEALDYAKRAVTLKQNDVSCWITLGNALFALGNWEEAMRAYATAHQLEPTDPTPSYNLGLAALREGLVGHARIAFIDFMLSSMPDDNRRRYVEETLQRIGQVA